MANVSRFAPLFKRNIAKAVDFAEKAFQKHNKEWDEAMVIQALVHQIDSTQSESLVAAWNKMTAFTQRQHAAKILEAFMATRATQVVPV